MSVKTNDFELRLCNIALSEAQKKLETKDLSACTLYTTVEPCAMCSFAIRETRIGRVVFSIKSPMMGGLSKWNFLRDTEVSRALPEVFGSIPEVIAGLLRQEAEAVWSKMESAFLVGHHAWRIFRRQHRKWLQASPVGSRRGLLRRLFALHSHPRSLTDLRRMIGIAVIDRGLPKPSSKPS